MHGLQEKLYSFPSGKTEILVCFVANTEAVSHSSV